VARIWRLPPLSGLDDGHKKKDGEETPGGSAPHSPRVVNSVGPRETLRSRGEQTQWRLLLRLQLFCLGEVGVGLVLQQFNR
jgi:hypothetical protein